MSDNILASDTKKNKGRTPFIPSDDQRRTVASLAAARHEQADIARAIGISVPTLRKHFAAELATRLSPDNLFTAPEAAPESTTEPARPDPLPPHPAPARARPPRTKRADGRKRWKPMRHQLDEAQLLIAANITPDVIARRLGITPATFRRAFAADLETASEMQRAELLMAMHRTAKGGNVTAQRHLIEIIERAELVRIGDKITGREAEKPAPRLGKKEQAQVDAGEIMNNPEWRDLLAPAAVAH